MVEKTIRLTGTSPNGIEDAIRLAIRRASVTLEGLRRAQLVNVRAELEGGEVAHWVVDVDVAFEVHDRLHG